MGFDESGPPSGLPVGGFRGHPLTENFEISKVLGNAISTILKESQRFLISYF